MKIVISLLLLLLLFFVPSEASAFVSHDYPAIYTHQIGRVFFLVACLFILSALIRNQLHKEMGWRSISVSLLWFIVWDVDVFVSHFGELWVVGDTDGWNYLRQYVVVEGKYYLFYLGRFDFVLLDLGLFFLSRGLSSLLTREEGNRTDASLASLLPFFPIVLSDVVGNIIMIILSVRCLTTSLKLYGLNRENAMWHYMVWLSSSYVMYSFSRVVGHIVKPVLIATGHLKLWRFLDPISGSVNNFNFFLVASVSLFFIGIYPLYLKILKEERKIEEINAELTEMNKELETLVAERTMALMGLTVADQVRNPAAVIGCTCKRVLAKDSLSSELTTKMNSIYDECKKLEAVVENFEYLLRSRRSIFRHEDINEVIRGIIKLTEKEISLRGLRLNLCISQQPLKMNIERNLLRVALFHVIRNGIDATQPGGLITVASSGDSDRITLTISDTGPGIPSEIREKIFDPFFTTKQHKFGMGLPLVKQIVSEHLGDIMIHSEHGKGTTVTITFPVRWKEAQQVHKVPLESDNPPYTSLPVRSALPDKSDDVT